MRGMIDGTRSVNGFKGIKDYKMSEMKLKRQISIPAGSELSEQDYIEVLQKSYQLIKECGQHLAPSEDINSLELAHLIPKAKETVITIYVGINDATCNKALVVPFLVRHGHNCVFVFDPQVFSGGDSVPSGTQDAKRILTGFEPPNDTWDKNWTYVMIEDPARTFESL